MWGQTVWPTQKCFWMAIPALFFFIFVFSIQLTVKCSIKFFLMTEFEPQTSWIWSDHSTYWAKTTAIYSKLFPNLAWSKNFHCFTLIDLKVRSMDGCCSSKRFLSKQLRDCLTQSENNFCKSKKPITINIWTFKGIAFKATFWSILIYNLGSCVIKLGTWEQCYKIWFA